MILFTPQLFINSSWTMFRYSRLFIPCIFLKYTVFSVAQSSQGKERMWDKSENRPMNILVTISILTPRSCTEMQCQNGCFVLMATIFESTIPVTEDLIRRSFPSDIRYICYSQKYELSRPDYVYWTEDLSLRNPLKLKSSSCIQ